MMKRLYVILLSVLAPFCANAQGWPANYNGVMLQAFYWDSFADSQWLVLEEQADELASSFDLVWIPQSGNCGGTSMGYDDLYWFENYNSSFGSEEQLRSMINTFKNKGIKEMILGFNINNIFDLHYAASGWVYSAIYASGGNPNSNRYTEIGYIPQAGTTAMGSVTLRF